jgi:hypothetical protein
MGTYVYKNNMGIVFIMNEFFRKWHYEYLLEQMCEIGLESRVGLRASGTHKKEKRHLFLGERAWTTIFRMKDFGKIGLK